MAVMQMLGGIFADFLIKVMATRESIVAHRNGI